MKYYSHLRSLTQIGDNLVNVLTGAGGHDILTGGGGAHVFKYRLNPGALLSEAHADEITDFAIGEDKIDLSDLDLSRSHTLTPEDLLNDGSLVLTEHQIYADLDGGGNNLVRLYTLRNVSTDLLGPDDFIL